MLGRVHSLLLLSSVELLLLLFLLLAWGGPPMIPPSIILTWASCEAEEEEEEANSASISRALAGLIALRSKKYSDSFRSLCLYLGLEVASTILWATSTASRGGTMDKMTSDELQSSMSSATI